MFQFQKLFLSGALVAALPVQAQTPPRQRHSFDADWRFFKAELTNNSPLVEGYALQKWRWKSGNDLAALTENTDEAVWNDATPAQDVFGTQSGFAWFRTTLAPRSFDDKLPFALRFLGVDHSRARRFISTPNSSAAGLTVTRRGRSI